MSTNYVPTAVHHDVLGFPVPGDPATAASVRNQALQWIADNAEYALSFAKLFRDGGTATPSADLTISQLLTVISLHAGDQIVAATRLATLGGALLSIGGGVTLMDAASFVVGLDQDMSFSPDSTFFVYAPTLSDVRHYAIRDNGRDGSLMIFSNASSNVMSVEVGGHTVATLRNAIVNTSPWALLVRTGGVWTPVLQAIKTF